MQPKPEVEFSRRPAHLTRRPRFPIRVSIYCWAYLLPFWIYPPPRKFLTLSYCKDDWTWSFSSIGAVLKGEVKIQTAITLERKQILTQFKRQFLQQSKLYQNFQVW